MALQWHGKYATHNLFMKMLRYENAFEFWCTSFVSRCFVSLFISVSIILFDFIFFIFSQADLQKIVDKRESFRNQLTAEISSLDQLNEVLNLLQELHDLENTIDDLYLPVEITYKKLL